MLRLFFVAIVVALRCASSFAQPAKFNTWQKKKLAPRMERALAITDVSKRQANKSVPIAEGAVTADATPASAPQTDDRRNSPREKHKPQRITVDLFARPPPSVA